jgi:hypothetical protein
MVAQQDQYRDRMTALHRAWSAHPLRGEFLGPITFELARKSPALQAAEMVAYEMNKNWEEEEYPANPGIGKTRPNLRPITEKLARSNGLAHGGCYTEGGLSIAVFKHNMMTLDEVSFRNFNNILMTERPRQSTVIMPYPSPESGQFVLVDKCPDEDTPHLHSRASAECLR